MDKSQILHILYVLVKKIKRVVQYAECVIISWPSLCGINPDVNVHVGLTHNNVWLPLHPTDLRDPADLREK